MRGAERKTRVGKNTHPLYIHDGLDLFTTMHQDRKILSTLIVMQGVASLDSSSAGLSATASFEHPTLETQIEETSSAVNLASANDFVPSSSAATEVMERSVSVSTPVEVEVPSGESEAPLSSSPVPEEVIDEIPSVVSAESPAAAEASEMQTDSPKIEEVPTEAARSDEAKEEVAVSEVAKEIEVVDAPAQKDSEERHYPYNALQAHLDSQAATNTEPPLTDEEPPPAQLATPEEVPPQQSVEKKVTVEANPEPPAQPEESAPKVDEPQSVELPKDEADSEKQAPALQTEPVALPSAQQDTVDALPAPAAVAENAAEDQTDGPSQAAAAEAEPSEQKESKEKKETKRPVSTEDSFPMPDLLTLDSLAAVPPEEARSAPSTMNKPSKPPSTVQELLDSSGLAGADLDSIIDCLTTSSINLFEEKKTEEGKWRNSYAGPGASCPFSQVCAFKTS